MDSLLKTEDTSAHGSNTCQNEENCDPEFTVGAMDEVGIQRDKKAVMNGEVLDRDSAALIMPRAPSISVTDTHS